MKATFEYEIEKVEIEKKKNNPEEDYWYTITINQNDEYIKSLTFSEIEIDWLINELKKLEDYE